MTGSIEAASSGAGEVRLTVTPRSDFYASTDERADHEAFELQEAIRRELPDAVDARAAPGEKGVITDVIIPLASGGALTAVVEVFKTWLAKRPTNRTIDLSFEVDRGKDGKKSGTLRLDSTNIDDAVLDTIAKEVLASGE